MFARCVFLVSVIYATPKENFWVDELKNDYDCGPPSREFCYKPLDEDNCFGYCSRCFCRDVGCYHNCPVQQDLMFECPRNQVITAISTTYRMHWDEDWWDRKFYFSCSKRGQLAIKNMIYLSTWVPEGTITGWPGYDVNVRCESGWAITAVQAWFNWETHNDRMWNFRCSKLIDGFALPSHSCFIKHLDTVTQEGPVTSWVAEQSEFIGGFTATWKGGDDPDRAWQVYICNINESAVSHVSTTSTTLTYTQSETTRSHWYTGGGGQAHPGFVLIEIFLVTAAKVTFVN